MLKILEDGILDKKRMCEQERNKLAQSIKNVMIAAETLIESNTKFNEVL